MLLLIVSEVAVLGYLMSDRFLDQDSGDTHLPSPVITEAREAGVAATAMEVAAGAGALSAAADNPPVAEAPSRALVALINDHRVANGLMPLYVDPALSAAASNYCGVVAPIQWRDHIGPNGSDWRTRSAAAGYQGADVVENLAWGFADSGEVFAAWSNEQAGNANLLKADADAVGVAHCAVGSGDFLDWWVFMAGTS